MAGYFLDSSAVVKRHIAESGSAWVRRLTDPAAGHDLYLARITGVEVVSALVRRSPPLPPPSLALVLADFVHDLRHQYRIIAIDQPLAARAMALAAKHHLRGYDAVQLAAALVARARLARRGLPAPTVVSADADLNTAALAEGLIVDNPNSHP